MTPDHSPSGVQILFVVSGPSGSGKETVISGTLERLPGLARVVTYTTRAPRKGEVPGRQYHFVNASEFERLVTAGEIFESETVYGSNRYGSPRYATSGTPSGDLIMELDPKGFLRMRDARTSPTVGIFLLVPDRATLRERIMARAQEQDLERRLNIARDQLDSAPAYDYLVVNRDRDACLAEVAAIVTAERTRHRGSALLERVRRDFKA